MSPHTVSTPAAAKPPARLAFAKRLRDMRVAKGFGRARHFAEALGLEENRYTRYERAEVEPSLSMLQQICAVLQTSPSDLLGTEVDVELPKGRVVAERTTVDDRVSRLAWRLAVEAATVQGSMAQQRPTEKLGMLRAAGSLFLQLREDPYGAIASIATDKTLVGSIDSGQSALLDAVQAYLDCLRGRLPSALR